ncbi:MAG: PDZ domain-containing protein, partial [Clostridia bacterium]|nr:PDZ domain-containing protein [Clostridia bacterium]
TMECIQHNAAINPGNSGGALVNQYGQLIGINSMKIISAEYEGMGFAVPSSVFVDVMNDIVVNGYVRNRPKIGISYVRASNEQAYAMFVAIKGLPSGSIVVAEISEDSDFYDKLQVGDLVTAINGEKLDSSADLAAKIEDMKVGDEITLDVVRINRDYSFKEFTFSGVLVEDRETVPEEEEEETSTSLFDDYFGDSRDSSENPYSDFFDDFFGDFFGNP